MFRSFVCDSIRFEKEVTPRIEKCYNQVIASTNEIDSNKDTERVVYAYKTGLKIPEDYQYQEITHSNHSLIKQNGSSKFWEYLP